MIQSIKLKNYRNIENLEIDLDKFNLIIAPNGSGKSNFLESIFYTVFRNSFRPNNNYTELVKNNKDFAKCEIFFDNVNFSELVIANADKSNRSVKLNAKRASTKKMIEKLPIILFAPHSVDLTNGSPEVRRNDLDNFLSLIKPGYLELLGKYKKVRKNRNAVIKAIGEGNSSKKELKYWTNEISKLNSNIYEVRKEFFEEIKSYVENAYQSIYHDVSEFEIEYLPNLDILQNSYDEFLQKFLDNEEKEIIVGKTLYGTHKDDYKFNFDGKNLRFHGSRGQQRIGSLIFKIAQLNLFEQIKEEKIIFLIDDIMSELDNSHRKNISDFLLSLDNQIILTGADENEIPKSIKDKFRLIQLSK